MLFNSIDFALFLPIIFLFYWFVTNKSLKLQNFLLVVASYIFYGWWDWRFLSLILFSTVVDYTIGYKLKSEENQLKRQILLWTSIVVNLGFLGFFKYYNFFLDNFISVFSFFGTKLSANALNIILPVGISFYTFQTLSYTIDVYKRKLDPTSDFIAFAAFVSFFPQLVAGPIERATNLLPQFYKKRQFDYNKAVDGMRQILWGLFKKIVIADNCAEHANLIFSNSEDLNGSTLFLGALFFTFQIYGDFSGYSDIAIGVSRLFGFNLKQNFAFPYFSRDIAEFWRRWHISLNTWFRDYLYIPLGGSRGSKWIKVRNTFIIFTVSGFWHGANWTFIIWGILNALFFLPIMLSNNNRKNISIVAQGRTFPGFKDFIGMIVTFLLTVFAWVFFRAENIEQAIEVVSEMVSASFFELPRFVQNRRGAIITIVLVCLFVLIEWNGRESQYAIANSLLKKRRIMRWGYYLIIIFLIFWFRGENQDFIYFQF
ncbi:MBOAT family O-acyltransferase [Tamlana sp. 2201CG12-4]|uniref:MBOAT family O-acyltransferase n=1 Tax=Tamlana sp. 2201CG12-4 TaxID=3112582 RepID=UPI002DBE9E63|nr:MBOAT family O-acyltransferase [Tamlana sp. 2201CG12-4]MEC3906304.1 MBOAT family O-acyltransferase [Tamlana sp. 2201CG12-4]